MASMIFYLMMFTFLAALAWAGWQVFRTNQSQERHGDDKKALTHRLEREQEEVNAARTDDRVAQPQSAHRAEAPQQG
jgi:hypothetical protein